jgi:nucleotide sugar dehydrogenase
VLKVNGVAIVGLGYVGLPLAILAQNKGYEVVGIDADTDKLAKISSRISPFVDSEVSEWLKNNTLEVTNNLELANKVETIIVCVPTPVDEDYTPDLTPVIGACTAIAHNLQKGQLVIIESTINPGVCEEIVLPLLEKESGLTCGRDFYLAHCPERINPGDEKWNVGNIARVVGGYDDRSLELAHKFYTKIVDATIRRMGSLKEAEAVKVVENSFRDVNIAFVNELAMSFTKLGIDVVNVIDGAATKPFAFMPHYPGAGVGGHCIPVDPYYLIEYAKQNGFHHEFLKTARGINNGMPVFTVDEVEDALVEIGKTLKGSNVTVLGLSYKPNVGDLRESPSLKIIDNLKQRGADVAVHDPYIEAFKGTKRSFSPELEPVFFERSDGFSRQEIIQSISNADAVIVATAHTAYKELMPEDFIAASVGVVVDGRNCLNKAAYMEADVVYKGIGR